MAAHTVVALRPCFFFHGPVFRGAHCTCFVEDHSRALRRNIHAAISGVAFFGPQNRAFCQLRDPWRVCFLFLASNPSGPSALDAKVECIGSAAHAGGCRPGRIPSELCAFTHRQPTRRDVGYDGSCFFSARHCKLYKFVVQCGTQQENFFVPEPIRLSILAITVAVGYFSL